MKKRFILFTFILFACSNSQKRDKDFVRFVKILEGTFSSKKQSEKDPSFHHVNLSNTRIWEDKKEVWFYQELYNPNRTTSIYNQRIIQVKRLDSFTISSTSFIIPDAKKYVNGWKNKDIFDSLTIKDLKKREGCDVFFRKKTSSIFLGKTKNKTCQSIFRKEMVFITSVVVLSDEKITSWDRGYDEKNRQVWGKIQEPYAYDKIHFVP